MRLVSNLKNERRLESIKSNFEEIIDLQANDELIWDELKEGF